MPTEPSHDDFTGLWRNQKLEKQAMNVAAVRARAEILQRRTRLSRLLALSLTPASIAFVAWVVWMTPLPMAKLGVAITLGTTFLAVWNMFRPRLMKMRAPPPESSAATLIAFQRDSLIEQRKSLLHPLLISAPALVGGALVTVAVFSRGFQLVAAAPMVLLSIAVIALWFSQRRQAKRLKGELDALDALEIDPSKHISV